MDTAAEKELLRQKINEGKATDEEIIRYKDELGGVLGPSGEKAYKEAKAKTGLTEAHTFQPQTVREGAKLGDTNITVGKNGSLPNNMNVNDYNAEALQQERTNLSPEDKLDEQNNGGLDFDPNTEVPTEIPKQAEQPTEQPEVTQEETTGEPSKPSLKELRQQYPNNAEYKEALKKYGYDVDDGDIYKPMSIQDAYYKGILDKSSRDYMMADLLAKSAGDLGRRIGNVGAQFSGGTIDNNQEKSLWEDRNKSMVETGVSAEQNKIADSNENLNYQQAVETINNSKLTNEQKNKQLTAARVIQNAMDNAKSGTERNILAGILTNVANGYADEATLIALGATGIKADANTIINIAGGSANTQATNEKFGGSTGDPLKDWNRGLVDKDIHDEFSKFNSLDDKGKTTRIRDLYKEAGGAKDLLILATLLDNGLVPENYGEGKGWGSIKYKDIVDKINKKKSDPKWLADYEAYTSDISNK